MKTELFVPGQQRQTNNSVTYHSVYSPVMQKKGCLSIEDNRQQTAVQNQLLGMIQRTKVTGITSAGVIQARVPNYGALNALKDRLPVDVIKQKLTVLIFDLWPGSTPRNINDWVNTIVNFDGSINQAKYERLFRDADPGKEKALQYKDPKQADTEFSIDDQKAFRTVLMGAKGLLDNTKSEGGLIYNVFGGTYSGAKSNYNRIGMKIEQICQNDRVDTTTDYNGDDAQIGAGGYADFSVQKVHFMLDVLNNTTEDKTTVIHECAHLIDNSIDDKGYFGSPGFENMSDDDKLHNAAHYEVVPGWIAGLTTYPKGMIFSYKSPAVLGIAEDGERQASEYLREAWDAAFNSFLKLREYVDKPLLLAQETVLKDFSNIMNLSMHSQTSPCQVTLLDVTLMERKTRNICLMMEDIQAFTGDITLFPTAAAIKDQLIAEALGRNEDKEIDKTVLDHLITKPYEHF